MKLRRIKCALFEHATGATLMTDVNAFLRGEAVATAATFPAGFIKEQEIVSVQVDGDRIVIFYTE